MIPSDELLRRALCDAITMAAGKDAPNTSGQCTVKVQGNSLSVRAATPPKIAVIEMRYLYGSSLSFTVTRSRYDTNLLLVAPGGDMTVEALGTQLFETFVSALRVV
jgi:hypothetical protein